jgi:hypothetical protein
MRSTADSEEVRRDDAEGKVRDSWVVIGERATRWKDRRQHKHQSDGKPPDRTVRRVCNAARAQSRV